MARRRPRARWDVFLALLVVPVAGLLYVNALTAYTCYYGRCSPPTRDQIMIFRIGLILLAAPLVMSYVAAIWRRARWSYLWLVAMTGFAVVAAIHTAVPQADGSSFDGHMLEQVIRR